MRAMDWFVVIVIIQVFYGVSISGIAHAIPEENLNYINLFNETENNTFDPTSVGDNLESNLDSSTDIPVLDLGALVFYSGNILVDMLLNSATALPQMLTFLVVGISMLVPLSPLLINMFQIFLTVVVAALWVVAILQLLNGMRSGRII